MYRVCVYGAEVELFVARSQSRNIISVGVQALHSIFYTTDTPY